MLGKIDIENEDEALVAFVALEQLLNATQVSKYTLETLLNTKPTIDSPVIDTQDFEEKIKDAGHTLDILNGLLNKIEPLLEVKSKVAPKPKSD